MFKRVTGLGADPKPKRATEDELRHEIASMESIHRANMRPFYLALAKAQAAQPPRITGMDPAFAAPYGNQQTVFIPVSTEPDCAPCIRGVYHTEAAAWSAAETVANELRQEQINMGADPDALSISRLTNEWKFVLSTHVGITPGILATVEIHRSVLHPKT